jgi:4-hydroxy-tetrahydrodipicolinate reductase
MAVRIAVFGAGGKVGRAIVRTIADSKGAAVLSVAVERPDFPYLAADVSQLAGLAPSGLRMTDQRPGKGAADVWIDFSSPAASVANVQAAAACGPLPRPFPSCFRRTSRWA